MINNKAYNWIDQAELVISALIAFFLPFNQKVVVYLIAALAGVHIFGWVKRGVKKLSPVHYPFMGLFLLYIFGLFFTTNMDYGGKDIETRATFLLFPLLYGLSKRAKPIRLQPILIALILGLLVQIARSYYYAYECFERDGYTECFEGTRLAYDIHPTYLSLYFLCAFVFYIFFCMESRSKWYNWAFAIIVSIVFLFMVYRLYSLGPWLSLAGTLFILTYAYFHFKEKKKYFFVGLIGLAGLGFLAVNNLSFVKSEVDSVSAELDNYFSDPEQYFLDNQDKITSINTRILIWGASVDLMKEHPFGVGTGDYKDVLMAFYRSQNMNKYAELKLNSHSQYFQTSIAIGIFSGLFLIGSLLYYIWLGFKRQNLYLIALVSFFAIACLFESVLERQWGIVFFMFFLSILADLPTKNVSKKVSLGKA